MLDFIVLDNLVVRIDGLELNRKGIDSLNNMKPKIAVRLAKEESLICGL